MGHFLPFFSFFGASFFFGVAFFSAPFVPHAMLTHPLSKTILSKTVFVVNNYCEHYAEITSFTPGTSFFRAFSTPIFNVMALIGQLPHAPVSLTFTTDSVAVELVHLRDAQTGGDRDVIRTRSRRFVMPASN